MRISLHPMSAISAALVAGLFALPALAETAHVLISVPSGVVAPTEYLSQLAAWRQSGQVSSALYLEQNQKGHAKFAGSAPGFASLTLLEFPSEGSFQSWKAEAAPKLGDAVLWRRADALTHGEITPRDSTKSTFIVNQYQPLVSPQQYRQYVDDYIVPNMANQKAARILIRYTMYLERDVEQPLSFLVMEYRDSVAHARSGDIKEAWKQKQASDPQWKKINDTKDSIRKAGPETYAVNLELPAPELSNLPSYKPETKVVGRLRIVGSELKNAIDALATGFKKFHPEAKVSTNYMTSSEGGIAGLYFDLADVAPMGDDAKITDMMPFHNTFGYMPTEISVATGGYEKRGSLWAFAVVVSKDNPLNEITLEELDRVFGSERTGGWELRDNNYLYTAKYARGPETNIRKWGQLGLKGEFAGKDIETFGYAAPGFAIYFERKLFHWSQKWNGNFKEYVETKQTTPDAAGSAVASERPLEALARNKYAIGIAGLMHAKDYPHVKVLKVAPQEGAPAVTLTPENVANRTYPLKRDAFFYVNRAPGKPLDSRVREFMRFVLSREGQEIIAQVNYYYPLTADYLQEQLKKLD